MRNVIAAALLLLLAVPIFATPEEEVRLAELAFAKAFVDRDADKFFGMLTEDAVFLGPGNTLKGRKAVTEGWGPLLKSPKPGFTWGPDRVVISGGGTLGLSYGPLYDFETGRNVGYYSSVWQKQADGSWKVIFDGPGVPGVTFADNAMKVEEGFVTAEDGAKLYYRKTGRGRNTIIAPLDFVLFDDLKQFADLATVITYDLRNRGRSSKVENVNTLTIQQDVKDLEAVRKHFNVEKFVPVGYSYLGKAVMLYALEHPDRVTRIVQLGPVAMRDDAIGKPKQLVKAELGIPEANEKLWNEQRAAGTETKSPREYCETQWGVIKYVMVGNPANAGKVNVKQMCELENEWPVNFNRHLQAHMSSVQAAAIPDADAQKVKVPVLTIHGTKDRNAPFEGGLHWAKTLPNARLIRVEGAAHQAWADDPVAVFAPMRAFLRGDWPLGAEDVN